MRQSLWVNGRTSHLAHFPHTPWQPAAPTSRLHSPPLRYRNALISLSRQSGTEVGGMSCGTEDDPSLGAGAFNEADSHKSFLEALNEWRRGNRGDNEPPATTSATSTAAAAGAAERVRVSLCA